MMKTFRKMTLTGALLAVLTSVFTPLHAQAEETSIRVTDAKIVGEDKEHADIVVSPYPSDHRAVAATFRLAK